MEVTSGKGADRRRCAGDHPGAAHTRAHGRSAPRGADRGGLPCRSLKSSRTFCACWRRKAVPTAISPVASPLTAQAIGFPPTSTSSKAPPNGRKCGQGRRSRSHGRGLHNHRVREPAHRQACCHRRKTRRSDAARVGGGLRLPVFPTQPDELFGYVLHPVISRPTRHPERQTAVCRAMWSLWSPSMKVFCRWVPWSRQARRVFSKNEDFRAFLTSSIPNVRSVRTISQELCLESEDSTAFIACIHIARPRG